MSSVQYLMFSDDRKRREKILLNTLNSKKKRIEELKAQLKRLRTKNNFISSQDGKSRNAYIETSKILDEREKEFSILEISRDSYLIEYEVLKSQKDKISSRRNEIIQQIEILSNILSENNTLYSHMYRETRVNKENQLINRKRGKKFPSYQMKFGLI